MIDIPAFNFIDAIAGVALLMGVLGGLKRGLSGELSRVLAIAVAGFAAWRFASPVSDWAMQSLSLSQDRSYVFSFVALLVLAFAAMWIVRITLRNLMEFAFKGRIERIGGALAGFIRATVIVLALVLMVTFAPQAEIQRIVMEESFVGRIVAQHLRPMYEDLQQRAPELGLPAPAPAEDPDLGEGEDAGEYTVEVEAEPEPVEPAP